MFQIHESEGRLMYTKHDVFSPLRCCILYCHCILVMILIFSSLFTLTLFSTHLTAMRLYHVQLLWSFRYTSLLISCGIKIS